MVSQRYEITLFIVTMGETHGISGLMPRHYIVMQRICEKIGSGDIVML